MKTDFYKKIIVGLIAVTLVFNSGFFLVPETKAQVATVEGPGPLLTAGAGTSAGINTGNAQKLQNDTRTWLQRTWDALKLTLGQALKKYILDRMVDAAVQWIQKGGFEGKGGPIVADWGDFFQQASEDLLGEMGQDILPALCGGSLKLNVAFSFLQPQKFSKPVTCTLNDIVTTLDRAFEDFTAESKGRWITYNAIWEPENNYFGLGLIIEDQKEAKLANLLQQKNIEATVNVGFRPQQTCKINAGTGKKVCTNVTPGYTIANAIFPAVVAEKQNAVLSANDIAAYVGALLDAIIYRYGQLAVGGLAQAIGYNDSQNTNNTYATYTENYFNAIDVFTLRNNNTLYQSTIDNILATKQSTLTAFLQSLTVEQNLSIKLTPLQSCSSASGFSTAQADRLIEVPIKLVEIQSYITDLQTRIQNIRNDITTLTNAKTTFNQIASSGADAASANRQMTSTYMNLENSGILNNNLASQELNSSQTELINIQVNAGSILDHDAAELGFDGFKDVITLCTAQTQPTP